MSENRSNGKSYTSYVLPSAVEPSPPNGQDVFAPQDMLPSKQPGDVLIQTEPEPLMPAPEQIQNAGGFSREIQQPAQRHISEPAGRAHGYPASPASIGDVRYPSYGYRGQPRSLSGMREVAEQWKPKGTCVPLLLTAAGGIGGALYAGTYGAGAGILLTGAAINLYRSAVNTDDERSSHLAFAGVAGAVGAWLAYKAIKAKGSAK